MEARDRKDLDPEQRLALLARALEADSTFAEAYVQSAVLSWRTDAFSRADSLLRAAARFRDDLPQYDALLLQWVEAWYRGDRDGAVSASRQLTLLDSRDDRVCRDATLTNQMAIAMPACMGSLGDPEYASAAGAFEFAWKDIGDMLHLAGDHEQELLRAREARALFPNRREAVLREIRALSALRRVDAIPALFDTLRARQNEGEVGARDWSLVWGLTVSAELLAAYGHNDLSGATAAEAVAWFDERDVRSMRHARALYVQGDFERARDIFAERVLLDAEDAAALGFAGAQALGFAGAAAARLGDTARAQEIDRLLEALGEQPFTFGSPTWNRAAIAAESGDLETAMRLLRESYQSGQGFTPDLRTDVRWANLQGYTPFARWLEPRD